MQFSRFHFLITGAFLLAAGLSASADDRRFGYVYPVVTSPKGTIELENTVTWAHRLGEEKKFDEFVFRHSIEIGVTDHLQFELYPANWSYSTERHRSSYGETAVEAIYNLTNPTTGWLGSAVYVEVAFEEKAFDIETKLLLQKNIGPFTIGYNIILDAEWEGDSFGHYNDQNGSFEQTLGVGYDVTKNFSVGAEVLHEIELPNWESSSPSVVYAGPSASYRFGRGYVTVAGLFQVTDLKEEPEVQTRVIVGISF